MRDFDGLEGYDHKGQYADLDMLIPSNGQHVALGTPTMIRLLERRDAREARGLHLRSALLDSDFELQSEIDGAGAFDSNSQQGDRMSETLTDAVAAVAAQAAERPTYDPPPFATFQPKRALKRLNMMFYGDVGCGKTVLTGSAGFYGPTSPMLTADAEGGTLSIEAVYGDTTDKVIARDITQFNRDMDVTHRYLADARHPFKTFAIDSGTEAQRRCMREILDESALISSGRKRKDSDVPEYKHWNQNHERMMKYTRYFRDLPMHFIMTAIATSDKDESTGSVKIVPKFPGQLSEILPEFFDVVGYMQAGTDKDGQARRVIWFQPVRNFLAKDRTNKLGDFMVNPSMQSIFEKILG